MRWAIGLATAMMHSNRGSAGREEEFPCYVAECHDASKPARASLPGGRAHHGVAPRTGAHQGPDVSPKAHAVQLCRLLSRDRRDTRPHVQTLTTENPDSVLFQSAAVNVTGASVPSPRVHLPLRRSLPGRPASPIVRHRLHVRQPAQV